MFKCLIALTSLLPAAVTAAPAWTWVDEQGRRHYSDTPVEGATQIELGGPQTFNAIVPAGANQPPQPGSADSPAFVYSVLDIISPENGGTLFNIEGNLELELATYPALRSSDRIDVILDGESMGLAARSLSITIPEVFRGEHTMQAVIVGPDGQELMRSAPVSFNVRQNTVLGNQAPGAPPRPALVPSNTGPNTIPGNPNNPRPNQNN